MERTEYPIQFSVEYPDRPLDRLTTAFRIFVAIPILIVFGAVSGGTWQSTTADTRHFGWRPDQARCHNATARARFV
jgi:hypothetical protein